MITVSYYGKRGVRWCKRTGNGEMMRREVKVDEIDKRQ